MNASRRTWLAAIAAGSLVFPALIRAAIAEDRPPRVIDLKIENREVAPALRTIRVTEGQTVELRWTSDETASLHLHGYDIEVNVRPGEPATMVVEAYAAGRFPVTSHGWGGHDVLTYLEVHPR